MRIDSIGERAFTVVYENFNDGAIDKNVKLYACVLLDFGRVPAGKIWTECHLSRVRTIDEDFAAQWIEADHRLLIAICILAYSQADFCALIWRQLNFDFVAAARESGDWRRRYPYL
jgi:hypothetical protein